MFSHLLKRALPFTLTFILGATLGGFFKLFGAGSGGRVYTYREHKRHYGGRGCDYRRNLLAESKTLVINFKPDARWPSGVAGRDAVRKASVLATFGADGKVSEVEPSGDWPPASLGAADAAAVWVAVERAARNISFTPETLNGRPVSVQREVTIRFLVD